MLKFNYKKLALLSFFLLFFLTQIVFADSDFQWVSVNKIKDLEKGEKVQTQGQVVALPGNLGSQFFYINGAQIYCYRKDFPELALGDKIKVKGEISVNRGEKRIKIKTRDDIKILATDLKVEPELVNIDKIETCMVGKLIKISGQVIERTGQKIFVGSDETDKEVLVYLKEHAEIDKSRIKSEDRVEIAGVLSRNYDEPRLLPRGDEDIEIISEPDSSVFEEPKITLLAGQTGVIKVSKIQYWLIASACILGFILIILLALRAKIFK